MSRAEAQATQSTLEGTGRHVTRIWDGRNGYSRPRARRSSHGDSEGGAGAEGARVRLPRDSFIDIEWLAAQDNCAMSDSVGDYHDFFLAGVDAGEKLANDRIAEVEHERDQALARLEDVEHRLGVLSDIQENAMPRTEG